MLVFKILAAITYISSLINFQEVGRARAFKSFGFSL